MKNILSSKLYVERDISWMYFNYRILQEATKQNIPLLERLNFLGIYSNNLDEFYRVRMATLGRLAECNDKSIFLSGEPAKKLIKQINKLNTKFSKEYEQVIAEVTSELRNENICLINESELTPDQISYVHEFFYQKLNGFISAVWLSNIRQLTDENDDTIHLAVKLQKDDKKSSMYAVIALPVAECGRFIQIPNADGRKDFMYLDDIIRVCLPMIFAGQEYSKYEAYAFKFTKDAEMEIDNDLRNGTLQKISKAVKSRKKGNALRIIYDSSMPKDMLKRVLLKLNIDKLDTVVEGGRYHNHKDFISFPNCGCDDLKYPAWTPIIKKEIRECDSLIKKIQKRDYSIHVPYHSFDFYIRVLQEAAISSDVKSIKTTLYRLAKDSKVVKALICAARNGKKVTVIIELMARFDEASNIYWSKRMQEAGINVIFGIEGLKIHSKITYIGLKTGSNIACISTGNFHEGNAKVYTDYMLITANRNIVNDVHSVFSFIVRPYSMVRFKELLVSPNEMRSKFIRLINDEIKNKQAGKPAYIKIKINHITDAEIIKKLYDASANGVQIDLLVRGNCSIVTGVPGKSENIRINGIIDRYLEHSRIFIFAAGGENKTFIGSSDWMPRNFDNRIEVVTPVYDPEIKKDLMQVVDFGLKDSSQGRIVDGTGDNKPWVNEDNSLFRSQEELYKYYLAKNEKELKKNKE